MTWKRVVAAALVAAAPAIGLGLVAADQIDSYVARQMQDLKLPGLALAVVRNGRVETIRTYGVADRERRVPVTTSTVFELGSVSKQFTATIVMMLLERGALRLDDPISRHLPDLPVPWQGITIAHLLTHTSGLRDYLSVPGLPDVAHARTHREMTRLFAQRIETEFAPGATWAYSNTGYLLLGDIVERVSRQSYWALLRDRVLGPAGMRATGSSAPRGVTGPRAVGYGWRDGAFERRPPVPANAYAAGAVVSTIDDMARWAVVLQGGTLTSSGSVNQMWTPVRVPTGPIPPFSYGFGWVVDAERGHRAVLHSGGTPGFSSAIRHYPEDRLTVVVLANHGDRIVDHIPRTIADIALPDLARVEHPDPNPSRSARLASTLRAFVAGKADPDEFSAPMRLFLKTATARGLGEWIASHGPLTSMSYVQSEPMGDGVVLRYRAVAGGAELWFSVTLDRDEKIAQILWW